MPMTRAVGNCAEELGGEEGDGLLVTVAEGRSEVVLIVPRENDITGSVVPSEVPKQ